MKTSFIEAKSGASLPAKHLREYLLTLPTAEERLRYFASYGEDKDLVLRLFIQEAQHLAVTGKLELAKKTRALVLELTRGSEKWARWSEFVRAEILKYSGQREEAVRAYEKTIATVRALSKRDDNSNQLEAFCWNNLGTLLDGLGRYKEALTALEAAKKLKAEDSLSQALTLLAFARVYENLGRYDDAIEKYEQVEKIYEKQQEHDDLLEIAEILARLEARHHRDYRCIELG